MFSYYGSKSKIIRYYSEPKHDIIIEPFAGSAQYAFKYWDKQVTLIEKNKKYMMFGIGSLIKQLQNSLCHYLYFNKVKK